MNQTTQQAGSEAVADPAPSLPPPRCHPPLNGTSTPTNGTYHHHPALNGTYNPLNDQNVTSTVVDCTLNGGHDVNVDGDGGSRGGSSGSRNLKTYHMQPRLFDDSAAFYSKYDPATGIRTASILGSCLFLVVIYGLYKTKCRKKEWTSQDQMFVENYKKRFNGRKGRRGTDFAFMREPFQRSCETSIAMEQTAKWIQSQPLHGSVQKNNFKSTMGNLCMDSFKASMYPVCDTNNINQMPNGKVTEKKQDEIKRLNERNLKLDLQVAYKDMFPFKQNLWKSRSYDDKVNMQAISTLGSICPESGVGEMGEGEMIEPGATAAKYPLTPLIVRNGSSPSLEDIGASAAGVSPRPVLHTLVPPHPSLASFTSRQYSHSDSLIPMLDDPNMVADALCRVAAFHIGTPSSCSSLEQDECFSLSASPLPSIPLNTSPLPIIPLTIIPPLPPYIPPKTNSVSSNSSENLAIGGQETVATTKL
jgi:hypothetical protein